MKNSSNDIITITFEGIDYKIKIPLLMQVISALENKETKITNTKEIEKMLEKYCLYDEVFLSELSKY